MKNWKYIEGAKTGNIAADITTDGNTWFVTTNDGKKKEFPSEREAEAYVKKIKTGNEDKTGAEEFFKQLSDDVKEREEKDDADIEKVGNANLETSVEKGKLGLWNWYVHKDGTIVSGGTSSTEANAKEMARKALEKEKAGNKVGNSKIGNATPNYRYKDFLITNPEGHEYIVFLKDGRTVCYRGTTSKAQAEDWCDWHDPKTGKSIGNSKTGNAKDKNGKDLRVGDIVLVWTSAGERAGKVKEVSGDRITVAIRNEGDWSTPGKLADKVSNSKTGNSASDDKFAYVMREFDAGKLKTPDGKVVTDPAQAKAIAYSESKKTENGLARARNAMAKNKKVGNHDFEEGDYVLYNGKKAVVRGFNGSQEVIIEQNGQRITTHWSNLEEYE